MITYSIIIILCILLYILQRKGKISKKIGVFYWTLITLLFLISAFRYNVGQDYEHWIDVYNWILNGEPAGNYVEIGYRYLNKLIQLVPFFNAYVLFFITSIFIIYGFGYLIYKNVEKEYWFLSVFMFICSGIFFASLNLIRQYIAVVIIAFGIDFLKKNKYISFVIFVLLASLFHTSALIVLVFLPFYLIFRNRRFSKALTIIYVLSLVFMVVDLRQILEYMKFIIPERWEWYLQSEFLTERNFSAITKQLVPNLLLIFVLMKRKQVIEKSKENDIYILMLFIDVIITNCFYGVLVLLRLSYFFDISLIFIIPIIFELLQNYNKKIENLGKLSIFGYYILLTVVTIFLMNGHGVMPYQTIFFK